MRWVGSLVCAVAAIEVRRAQLQERLEARRDEALQEIDEVTYRIWRLYMAACALEFEAGGTGLYQIVASKRDGGAWPVPLTRRDLYRG